jgi:1-deoxy-D-xylulose-5-phosphate reductoisomerase
MFDLTFDQIEVVIHPEAKIHAMVHFIDGNTKALLSETDMKMAISYAMSYPSRLNSKHRKSAQLQALNFETFDASRFPCFNIAMKYLKMGGNFPIALTVINDHVVQSYLEGDINYTEIPSSIEALMSEIEYREVNSMEDIDSVVKDCQEKCLNVVS